MTHHFVAFLLLNTVIAFLVRKKHSETEIREIFYFFLNDVIVTGNDP